MNTERKEIAKWTDLFLQPQPYYGIEKQAKGWKTIQVKGKHKPCGLRTASAHLAGAVSLGSIAKWYPAFALIDIDGRDRAEADEIRKANGFTERNSILAASKSKNHYHLLAPASYRGKPPTIGLFTEITKHIEDKHGIEVYPRGGRIVRLPFGKHFTPLDESLKDKRGLELFEEFQKLDDWDMFNRYPVRKRDLETLPLFSATESTGVTPTWYREGKELFGCGLLYKGTRYDAQAKVLYYLLRSNYAQGAAIETTFQWLKAKHNGYSEKVSRQQWDIISSEITRQAKWFYANFERADFLPDSLQQKHTGYITKPQLIEIVKIAGGNLPRMKFYTSLFQYLNPRRAQPWTRVHTDYFTDWSRDKYICYLQELEAAGVIKRNHSYCIDNYAKTITVLNKNFLASPDKALLDDNRSPESLPHAIRLAFTPAEYRDLLRATGAPRQALYDQVKAIFDDEGVRKAVNIIINS